MTHESPANWSLPLTFLLRAGFSILRGHKRSFTQDAVRLLARREGQITVAGAEHIPDGGRFVVTANHYTRRGFGAWWISVLVSAAISAAGGQSVHWIMTSYWSAPGKWYAAIQHWLTRRLFTRLARMYGFSGMPPVPLAETDAAESAGAVRHILTLAKSLPAGRENPPRVFGFVPEGRDFPGAKLGWPPYAAGRFVHQLNRTGYQILPAGLYEEDGQMILRFGRPYDLGEPHSHASGEINPVTFRLLTRRQTDLLLTRTVMHRIAVLLPESMQGAFGETQ